MEQFAALMLDRTKQQVYVTLAFSICDAGSRSRCLSGAQVWLRAADELEWIQRSFSNALKTCPTSRKWFIQDTFNGFTSYLQVFLQSKKVMESSCL